MKRSMLCGIIILSILSIILLGLGAYNYIYRFRYINYEEKIVLNYMDDNKEITPHVCFGSSSMCENLTPEVIGTYNTKELGEYSIKYIYKYNNKTLELFQKIEVKDLISPSINTNDNIKVCKNGKILNLKVDIKDNYDKDIKDYETSINDNKLTISTRDSSNNISTKEIDITYKEDEKPKIKLKGNKTKTIYLNSKYKDEGATVSDDCDDNLEITTSGSVDTKKTGTYKIKYSTQDSSNNKVSETRTIYVIEKPIITNMNNTTIPGNKIIYLTFDDGPSSYTNKLLDILKKYNVKVTFFVTGKGSDAVIKRAYDEGHTIALHTYSHTYSNVYSSVDNYFTDLNKISNRVKNITGVESKLIRFPGGSSNTVSRSYDGKTKIMSYLTKEVEARGYKYFDWNVSSGDAGGASTSTQVYNNVVSNLKSSYSIVLQHDIKGFSVNAVENIIIYGLNNGYTFLPLTMSSPTAHHRVNN